jgi:type IV pilus assembly protein PilM
VGSGVSAAKFHENVCDFGVVYGLALQGLDLAKIESNLLPRGAARSMAWARKSKYFTAAACILLLVSVLSLARTFLDKANYSDKERTRRQIGSIISAVNQSSSKLKAEEDKGPASEVIIQKGFELYKYRDIIPLLMQTIISTLPNKKNNAEQQHLYTAFAAGDVRAILEIPRKQRKQIFVTNMSVIFVDDVDSADLSNLSFTRGRKKVRRETLTPEQRMMLEQMMGGGRMAAGGQRDIFGRQKRTDETKTGFVVSISGYSPYENIGELLDPARVEDQPDKWGVITRFLHLDDIVDGNSPFELYERTDVKHFKLETGQVDFDAEMPQGIGLVDTKVGKKSGREEESEQILIDPMTKEIISRVVELDENGREKLDRAGDVVYKVNDHWFTLDAKFVWKDAPKPQQQQQ